MVKSWLVQDQTISGKDYSKSVEAIVFAKNYMMQLAYDVTLPEVLKKAQGILRQKNLCHLVEMDIQEKDKKKTKNKPNQARDGKDKVKSKPKTARALIDVHGEQMTLRHDDQSATFKVGNTKTFSYNIIELVNRVDVIDIACEEYVQEVLEISKSGNPTSTSDPMIDSRSPSFTPFEGSDFLMEEIDEFLKHDDSIPPGVDGIYDFDGDTVTVRDV
ncbi:hypothetical protein Tco_1246427 [Tanacetum coccineum]